MRFLDNALKTLGWYLRFASSFSLGSFLCFCMSCMASNPLMNLCERNEQRGMVNNVSAVPRPLIELFRE